MQRSNTYRKSNSKGKTPFDWKKWLAILLGVLLIFPAIRYVIKQVQKVKETEEGIAKTKSFNENQNPIVVQTKADKITTRKDIQAAANDLSHHLGTKYSDKNSWWDWLNPKGWSENDALVAQILITQRLNFKLLERLYYGVYSNSRSLRDDVLNLLDAKELKKVQKYLNL